MKMSLEKLEMSIMKQELDIQMLTGLELEEKKRIDVEMVNLT